MSAGVEVLRRVYPRVLAKTLSLTRSLPEAEDAVQEAVARALSTWPERGTPDAPEAWLVTVATNAHRDRLRRGKWETPTEDVLESVAEMSPWAKVALGEPSVGRGWKDELLRLVFACCHPALEPGESAALCLATVVGLSTREVALAFVTEPRSMEQRLTRARRRLRERGDADGAAPTESRDRLDAVLCVVHLLFGEGYWSSDDEHPIRVDLCGLAIGLAHSLADTFDDEPEVLGLLALLTLHDARRAARLDADGAPLPLPDQNRGRWDQLAIDRGLALLDSAATLRRPGPLQLEAAISAVHCRAASADETDWEEIAALYRALEDLRPTPAVRVNRAFAVARSEGPAAGLALLGAADIDAGAYPYVHLVRGTLLGELGRSDDARESLLEAREVARNEAERAQIERRIEALGVT